MGIWWEFRGNLVGIFGADNQDVNRFRGNFVGIWWEFRGNLVGKKTPSGNGAFIKGNGTI